MSTDRITEPAAEPVTLDDMLQELGYGPQSGMDPDTVAMLSGRIVPKIAAARMDCETHTRRAFVTQTWQHTLDGFPGLDCRYSFSGFPAILLPRPPFQRIRSFRYVDLSGTLQTLSADLTYGEDINLQYGYQLSGSGSESPVRILPPFARTWPPTRRVADSVIIQFDCGYGGPLTVSMGTGSNTITGATFLPSDIGRAFIVPGAGAGDSLSTTILSVDANGNGTAAAAATTGVNNVQAYLGKPVPATILLAIRQLAQVYFEQGTDVPMPQSIQDRLAPYRNLIS